MNKVTKEQYEFALARVEELLPLVDDNTPLNDKNPIELDLLVDVIKLRMYEMGLNQVKLLELLEVSLSRVSDYLTGRCEPTLKVARVMSRKLNIDANIVLGI